MMIAILVWNGADKYIVWCWELRKCRYVFGIALLFAVLSVKRGLTALDKSAQKLLAHDFNCFIFIFIYFILFIIYFILP